MQRWLRSSFSWGHGPVGGDPKNSSKVSFTGKRNPNPQDQLSAIAESEREYRGSQSGSDQCVVDMDGNGKGDPRGAALSLFEMAERNHVDRIEKLGHECPSRWSTKSKPKDGEDGDLVHTPRTSVGVASGRGGDEPAGYSTKVGVGGFNDTPRSILKKSPRSEYSEDFAAAMRGTVLERAAELRAGITPQSSARDRSHSPPLTGRRYSRNTNGSGFSSGAESEENPRKLVERLADLQRALHEEQRAKASAAVGPSRDPRRTSQGGRRFSELRAAEREQGINTPPYSPTAQSRDERELQIMTTLHTMKQSGEYKHLPPSWRMARSQFSCAMDVRHQAHGDPDESLSDSDSPTRKGSPKVLTASHTPRSARSNRSASGRIPGLTPRHEPVAMSGSDHESLASYGSRRSRVSRASRTSRGGAASPKSPRKSPRKSTKKAGGTSSASEGITPRIHRDLEEVLDHPAGIPGTSAAVGVTAGEGRTLPPAFAYHNRTPPRSGRGRQASARSPRVDRFA